MKFISLLLLLCSTLVAFPSSVILSWNQNTETNVSHYLLYRGVNGGNFSSTKVLYPNHSWTYSDIAAGTVYNFYVTAVNTTFLESAPSLPLTFSLPLSPPAIDILSVQPTGIGGANWTGVLVTFSQIDLAAYKLSNVVLTATPTDGTAPLTFLATASPYTVPSLPVRSYMWAASASNSTGTSPPGGSKLLSGIPPATVQNIQIVVGP